MGLGFLGEQVTISGSRQPPPHSGQSQGDRWHPSLLRTPTPVCRICRLCLLPTCHSGRFLGPLSLGLASSFPLFHLNHLLFPSTSPPPPAPLTESHLPSQGGPSTLFQSLSTVPLDTMPGISGQQWKDVAFSSNSTTKRLWPWALSHPSIGGLSAAPHLPQLGFTKRFLTLPALEGQAPSGTNQVGASASQLDSPTRHIRAKLSPESQEGGEGPLV